MAQTGRELWPCWPGKTAICTFNEAKEIAADKIFRSVIILQLTTFAMEAANRAGLDKSQFHINEESITRFYDSNALEEDNFNGIWYDWEDGDTQYRIATSFVADPEEQTIQTDVCVLRLNPLNEDWEIFDGEKWLSDGPPAEYFDLLLEDELDGWDDDDDENEEIDPWEEDSLMSLPVSLSIRTKLHAAGVNTIGDLMNMTANDVLRIPGIGAASLGLIEAAMEMTGFGLKERKK